MRGLLARPFSLLGQAEKWSQNWQGKQWPCGQLLLTRRRVNHLLAAHPRTPPLSPKLSHPSEALELKWRNGISALFCFLLYGNISQPYIWKHVSVNWEVLGSSLLCCELTKWPWANCTLRLQCNMEITKIYILNDFYKASQIIWVKCFEYSWFKNK